MNGPNNDELNNVIWRYSEIITDEYSHSFFVIFEQSSLDEFKSVGF